jgi:high affinity Mn2+ porin
VPPAVRGGSATEKGTTARKRLGVYYVCKIDDRGAAFNYQFFLDPAHNADRGPVSVFAARLHAEF